MQYVKSATVAIFEKVPIWHFWGTAGIFKIFVAKQLFLEPNEKVIT